MDAQKRMSLHALEQKKVKRKLVTSREQEMRLLAEQNRLQVTCEFRLTHESQTSDVSTPIEASNGFVFEIYKIYVLRKFV